MFEIPHAPVGLTLFGPLLFTSALGAAEPLRLEVFTATRLPIAGKDDHRLEGAAAAIYAVDGVAQFESILSENLPADAGAAKAEVLRRIGVLNDARVAPAKGAAVGLAKAAQYGVDRYPAIVFNGTAVVYGVTDLVDAVERYRAWRKGQSR